MNDLSDASRGGTEAEAIADASQVDTAEAQNADDTAAQDTGTDDASQADEPSEPPKRKPWWEKRFDELTRQKYDEQRRADYLQGQIDALQRGQSAPQQQQVGPPDRWEDPDGYDRWLINEAAKVALQQQQTNAKLSTFAERENAARQSHPDYDSVARDPNLPITPLMAQVISESELGPEVAYHLGTNRDEARRIASLAPHLQAAALGRIEAALTKAPPVAQTRTPSPPPKTVSGLSAGINKSPGDMTMAEYVAARQAGTI